MSERSATESPKTRLDAPGVGLDLVGELRATLERAGELIRVVETNLRGASDVAEGASAAERIAELERRLSTAESDVKELASRLVDSEHQGGRLMNLYVATYQLHATLDPGEVQATIAEIAINLLGAERFVLLFRKGGKNEGEGACEIAFSEGMEENASGAYHDGIYAGGDPAVDATLADGILRIGPLEGSEAMACVPLTVQGTTVGALVILKLFDHKALLRPEDRDLLDLIAAHAASALFAARVYSNTDRKLKTLESLVALVRRQ